LNPMYERCDSMSLKKFKECVDSGDVLGTILSLPHLPDLNMRYYDLFVDTPLNYALEKNMPVMVISELIKIGASLHKIHNEHLPPLHVASGKEDIEVIKLLLDSGADIDETDERGWTPLHYAAMFGNSSAALLLVSVREGLLGSLTKDGMYASDIAGMFSHIEMRDMLKKLEYDYNNTTQLNET